MRTTADLDMLDYHGVSHRPSKKHVKRVGIYRMISPSGKVYIGQSRDITNRKSRYKTLTCKNQSKLYASLKKYGYDAHNFEVLVWLDDDISQEKLSELESFVISIYKDSGAELLNLKDGGSFGKHPLESRLKNSLSHKGKAPWKKGLKGEQVAWNKGLHEPRKQYKFFYNGKPLIVNNLKSFCSENKLNYFCMLSVHNKTGHYKNKTYKGYGKTA